EGGGFPPQFLGRAFERFARADGTRAGASAGLGLAIVLMIAEAHGGTASVANGPAVASLTRAGVPRALIGRVKERAGAVRRVAASGAFVRVALAANAVSGLMAQLYGHFHDRVPPSVLTL